MLIAPVARLVAVIVAFDTPAPVVSATVPVRELCVPTCASPIQHVVAMSRSGRQVSCFMGSPVRLFRKGKSKLCTRITSLRPIKIPPLVIEWMIDSSRGIIVFPEINSKQYAMKVPVDWTNVCSWMGRHNAAQPEAPIADDEEPKVCAISKVVRVGNKLAVATGR